MSTIDTPIDIRVLKQIGALDEPGEPSLVAELVQLFLGHAPGLLDALTDAWRERDLERVHATAHSLKSSSLSLGALWMAELCQTIERAAAVPSLEPIELAMSVLHDSYGRTAEALCQYAGLSREHEW